MSKSSVRIEFLLLMAAMMCLLALYIDAMLPALLQIGADLGAIEDNRYQMVITSVMVGMAVGQLFYGPISDSIGRKPAVYIGFFMMLIGTLICIFAYSFEWMMLGRFIQGIGAAGPRVMVAAIIRDRYSGPEMAKVLSLVMTIFIFVPVVAPLVGQVVLLFAGWRSIFVLLGFISVSTLIWFSLRQPETLNPDYRRPLSLKPVLQGMYQIVSDRDSLVYTLAGGLVYGSLIGFLTSIQGILSGIYQVGAMFPVYFAMMALGIGFSSFINSRLVYRFKIRSLVRNTLLFLGVISLLETAAIFGFNLVLALPLFVLMLSISTFCFGLLFGNINALAMEPFAKLAGVASGTIGAIMMVVGVIAGSLIGMNFDGTIVPLILGFALTSLGALGLILLGGSKRIAQPQLAS